MLEDILKKIALEVVTEKVERHKQPVGVVSEDLRKEYCNWKEEKEELEAEIEFRMERLKVKLERELEKEFKPKFDQMTKEKKELWDKIKAEIGLIGESDLNINTETGEISRWVDEIDFTKH